MRVARKNLMLAVRDQLRREVPLADSECEIELDEGALPATIGKVYVVVAPSGWQPGPCHNASGGVNDLLYGIKVMAIARRPEVPRDRRRDAITGSQFLDSLGSLDDLIDQIFETVDYRYDVINAANTAIQEEINSDEGFIEPLRFAGMEDPKPLSGESFGSRSPWAGMISTLHFHGARRITTKTRT